MNTPHSVSRVKMSDKRVYGGKTDVNQLVPFKYSGVWDGYIKANERHWMPTQFNFNTAALALREANPIVLKSIENFIGLLSVSSSLFPSLGVAIYGAFSSPEHRQYMLRLNFEESVHGHLALTLSESLGINLDNCHNAFLDLPVVQTWLKIRKEAYEVITASQDNTDAKGFVTHLINASTQAWVLEQHYALMVLNSLSNSAQFSELIEVTKRYLLDKKTHMSFFIGACRMIASEMGFNLDNVDTLRNDQAYVEYARGGKYFSEAVVTSYQSVLTAIFSKNVNTFLTSFEVQGESLIVNKAESVDTSKTSSQTETTAQLSWD